ncbi:MAG: hypothetical protein JXM70_08465 [Pirellulales bacterium]|nr:hypothetical protein [Pirellulales bacterium]
MFTRVVLLCLICLTSFGYKTGRMEASDDIRKDLKPPRLTIAMWDFSWLYCHYPGGSFEDFDKVTDELIERGFNTVRIDAFPLVVGQLIAEKKKTFKVPADPLRTWGPSEKEYSYNVVRDLIAFMTITKEKGINVILSSWGIGDRKPYSDRAQFWKAWETVLDILQERGLLEHVMYVDFDQEFPYFTPFADEIQRLSKTPPPKNANQPNAMQQAGAGKGAWNYAQRAFIKDYFESTLAHFHKKYPGIRFTFSLTNFWPEIRSLKPVGLDVLELHIWIKGQLDEYTGFNKLKKDRDPANDYKAYMAGIREALKHQDSLRNHMKQQMQTASSWAKELGVPLTTTEAWGPWWHMDHPDLEWDWLYDWCEYCMGLSSEYEFWGSTPWNYSHPYWKNWDNIEWYRKVNGRFLKQ